MFRKPQTMPQIPPETAKTVDKSSPANTKPEKKKKKKSKKINFEEIREKYSSKKPGGRPIPKLRCSLFSDHIENVKSKIQDKALPEDIRPNSTDRFGKIKPRPQDRKFAPVFALVKQRKINSGSEPNQKTQPNKEDDAAAPVALGPKKEKKEEEAAAPAALEPKQEKKEEEAAAPVALEATKVKKKVIYKFACEDIRYIQVSCLKVALPQSPTKPKYRTTFSITKDQIFQNLDTKKWVLVGCGTYCSWLFGGQITDENLKVLNTASDGNKEDFKNSFVAKALVKSKLASILFNKDDGEFKQTNLYDYIRSTFAADFMGNQRSVRMNFTKADGEKTYIIILSKSSAKIPALVYLFDEVIRITKMNDLDEKEKLLKPTKKEVREIWENHKVMRSSLDMGPARVRKIPDEENEKFFGY